MEMLLQGGLLGAIRQQKHCREIWMVVRQRNVSVDGGF